MREPGGPKFEDEREPKRLSPISRIVGLPKEREKEIHKTFETMFKNQGVNEVEREKSQDEKEIVRDILAKMPDFVKRYGGKPVDSVVLDNIHFLDKGKFDDEANLASAEQCGAFNPFCQFLYVIGAEGNLKNAHTVCHELLHLNSFQSLWFKENNGEEVFNIRRSGFTIHGKDDGDTIYFNEISEAITEELSIRFEEENFADLSIIGAEVKKRDKFKKEAGLSMKDVLAINKKDSSIDFAFYSYSGERKKLNKIIDDIYDRNHDRFASVEEVFDVFARAYFTGKLLPVAHLIEKTYGKGAFRKIAQETKKEIQS